ncbi:MAG: DUF4340 domain-containing protein [Desulfarculaceae bacterium]|nr:DUF4340 domain-containing protein [Desulfarculaceae bacterium]
MKKEYIFLSVIIVALCAYLFLHSSGESNYTLPEIETVKASDIKRFEISRTGGTVTIVRQDGNWVVSDKKYPADKEKIKKMGEAVEGLELTALVSENEDFQRYDLDRQNRVQVLAASDSGKETRIMIGKVAPTRNHTFVKLEGDDRIYHASGNLEKLFDRTVSEIRDKQVVTIDPSNITGLKIRKQGREMHLERTEQENGQTGAWKSADASDIDENAVESLLSKLSDLTCSRYLDPEQGPTKAAEDLLAAIELKGNQSVRIELFEKNKEELYPGRSSQNQYPFLLKDFQAENILSDTDTILGIDREQSNENDS